MFSTSAVIVTSFIFLLIAGRDNALHLHQSFARLLGGPAALRMSTVEPDASVMVPGTQIILRASQLTKAWVGVPQFEDISLMLGKGQRVGLIGVNGAGKSTLLKCLAKIDSADSGKIELAQNTNVIYVDQEPDWSSDLKVYQALFSGNSPAAIATRMYYQALDPDTAPAEAEELLLRGTDGIEAANAWGYGEQAINFAEKLNIKSHFLYRTVGYLSGGERKRVALACALSKSPDILLLDEVSNMSFKSIRLLS